MAGTRIELDRRFAKRAKGLLEKYEFQVGVPGDRRHKRKPGSRSKPIALSDLSEVLRRRFGINFYTEPFQKNSNDRKKFVQSLFDLCAKRGTSKKVSDLAAAVVKNPILKGQYGTNSRETARKKGSNKLFIDTGQLVRAIQAKVKVRRVS